MSVLMLAFMVFLSKRTVLPKHLLWYFAIVLIVLVNSIVRLKIQYDYDYLLLLLFYPSVLLLFSSFDVMNWNMFKGYLIGLVVLLTLYALDIVQTPYSGYQEMDLLGNLLEEVGFSGPFQTPHLASVFISYLAVSTLYIFVKTKRLIWLIFYLVAFYIELQTKVRTGLMMAIIGSLFLILMNNKNRLSLGSIIKLFSGLVSVIIVIVLFLPENRISSEIQSLGGVDLMKFASGRGRIWYYYAKSYEFDLLRFVFGLGRSAQYDIIEPFLHGQRLLPHNGFMELFYFSGVLGFSSMLLVLRYWWSWRGASVLLIHSFVFMILIFMLFQSFTIVHSAFFIVPAILLRNESIISSV